MGSPGRDGHSSESQWSYGHQRECGNEAMWTALWWDSQQHLGRAVDGSKTALSDGEEVGEEGGGRKERTNGRQAGLSNEIVRDLQPWQNE